MSHTNHYTITPEIDEEKISFYFESVGKGSFLKAIKYSLLSAKLEGRAMYNLGFGDYDKENKSICDTNINNNGDVYKVFNTVLNTVPLFFKENPYGIIAVEGSDSDAAYFDVCKLSCKRKCTDRCKKEGRRIALYCRFVNNNYSTLSNDYIFEGGVECEGDILVENYEVGKPYNMILIYNRNKINFIT
jgi:hypothetical protein